MATLLRRSWGQTKPIAGSTIDWGHPLAQGLWSAILLDGAVYPFSNPQNVKAFIDTNATAPTSKPGGLTFASANRLSFSGAMAATGNQLCTAAGSSQIVSVNSAGNGSVAGKFNTAAAGASNAPFFLGVGGNVSGKMYVGRAGAAANTYHYWDGPTIPTGKFRQWGVTYADNNKDTVPLLYLEGVPQAAASSAFSSGSAGALVTDNAADPVFIGSRPDLGFNANCTVGHLYVYSRVLRLGEVAWLAAEPYVFFTPPASRALYFDLGTTTIIAKTGTAYASAGAVMLDSGTKAITGAVRAASGATARDASTKSTVGQSTAEAGATARDSGTKASTGAAIAPAGAAARTTAKKRGAGATIAALGATAGSTAKKTIVGAVRWALGLVGYAHPAVIVRDIDYKVGDVPTAWRAGDVDTAWEASDVPTAWKAGDA